jgi:spermidine/putrescine-binding protein
MFNLAYKKKSKIADPKQTANNVINFIEEEVKQRLEPNGKIYLTFDPLPKSDLGMEKNFKFSPDRKKINKDYKSNRVHDEVVLTALKLLRKYYTYRGNEYLTVISSFLEADDYVEGLVNLEEEGMIALISTDMDWARYISDRVHMINNTFDKPYTKQDFFDEKGYFPTIAAITLDKAIFGDKSDCIEPILTKKNKIYKDSSDFIRALIKEVSKTDVSLKDVENVFEYAQSVDLIGKAEKSHVEDIIAIISVSNNAMEAFHNNIRLIKCRCDDVTKYIIHHAINQSYNALIETTLGRNKSSKQKFHFGNIS